MSRVAGRLPTKKRTRKTIARSKKRVRFETPRESMDVDVMEVDNPIVKPKSTRRRTTAKPRATTKKVNVEAMDVEQPQVKRGRGKRDSHTRRNAKNYETPCKKLPDGYEKEFCKRTAEIINYYGDKNTIQPYEPYKYRNSVKRRVAHMMKQYNRVSPRSKGIVFNSVFVDNVRMLTTGQYPTLTSLIKHNNDQIKYVAKESSGNRQLQKQCVKNLNIDTTKPLSDADSNSIKECVAHIQYIKDNFKCKGNTHIVAPTCRKNLKN